jgi:hypothetical protein
MFIFEHIFLCQYTYSYRVNIPIFQGLQLFQKSYKRNFR